MDDMIRIKGKTSQMGTNDRLGHPDDLEGPKQTVKIKDFKISSCTVTNQDFKEFVNQTNYITEAEQFGDSFVFMPIEDNKKQNCCNTELAWWKLIKGASWLHPQGPDSSINLILDHPVVHVSHKDASAYCEWQGGRLPNEIEWEFAARGNNEEDIFPWGNKLIKNNEHQANTFQGTFPIINTKEDGYSGIAPVKTYKPNQYGLYQMIGNVWEWQSHKGAVPLTELIELYEHEKINEIKPGHSEEYVAVRGGSFLCHSSYCNRYRVAARNKMKANTSASNLGFRVVMG